MRLKNIFSSVSLIFTFPFRLFRKTKIDNFVAGIIFGAIFSMVVNIATVRVQEDITKQRVFEALEREIVVHYLDTNTMVKAENEAWDSNDNQYLISYDLISRRFETRIWESENVSAYLFEIDPAVAGKIQAYYGTISTINSYLGKNEESFWDLYHECTPTYEFLEKGERKSIKDCNELLRITLTSRNAYAKNIYDTVENIRKDFHPTQDRLDNWWLSLLLGNKAYEVVKVNPSK